MAFWVFEVRMLLDIRVKTELPRHRKFKKLKRIIGDSAMEHLITFWCNIAEQVPNGVLNGWSNDDISDAACWGGEPSEFVSAMIESGFIDATDDGFIPHDWAENQPWVVESKERSEKARTAGKASAAARLAKYGTAQPPNGCSNGSSEVVGTNPELTPNPRTPSPSPSPNKKPKEHCPSDDGPGTDGVDFLRTYRKRKLNGKRWETFKLFWDAFDYKHGKRKAADSWLDIPSLTNDLVGKIISSAKLEAQKRPVIVSEGKTPKMAQGWISECRWEDEIEIPECSGPRQTIRTEADVDELFSN